MAINFAPVATKMTMLGVKDVPFSIVFFDIFGRICGRLFLVSLNALFWTQCKTTENFMMEHHPSWVDLGDLRTLHNRIHYILGVFFMGIPMIVHCVLIFLPPLTGIPLNLVTNPPPNKINPFIMVRNPNSVNPLALPSPEIFITHDNIWRVAMAIVLFGVIFPFSMSNYGRKRWFTATMTLHVVCAALFTIDQIRRAPHGQVFNTPAVAYFLADRFIGLWLYRTGEASVIHRELLDTDYMVVFLYVPSQKRRRQCGSTYYVQFTGIEGALDFAHPFVTFQNHSGDPLLPEWTNRDTSSASHKFYVDRSKGDRRFNRRASVRRDEDQEEMLKRKSEAVAAESEDMVYFSNWNTALIIQIHKWNTGDESFTARLSRKDVSAKIRFWGPYLSEYGDMTPDGKRDMPPMIQIGTGAGCGPLLDFYMHFTTTGMELPNPVTVYFSTNSLGLFQFFTDLTCAKAIHNYSVNAHLTSANDYEKDFEAETLDDQEAAGSHSSERDMKLGRLSFMDVLKNAPRNSEVFFCGAPALQWKVEVACATYNLLYHPGHRYTSDGGISCHRVGPAKFVCNCTKYPCCLVL